ncbi:MAG TPA: response regulator [Candidatus Nitrosotalea sp.]|nr:response regulator [Candidatus Nitrosotalea sp.]
MARILVVDDEPDVADLVALILGNAGHQVDIVHGGRAALGRLESTGYDMLICDLVMPNVNGIAVWEAVQARPAPRPRVVFLSGYYDAGGYEEFIEKAGVATLPKPFDFVALPDTIARLLESPG